MRADGTLDRAAMRRRVFDDAEARRRLEGILHPRIRLIVEQRYRELDVAYVVIVIPLLAETGGYRDLLDRVLVVDCPESLQVERVMARSGLAEDEVKAILAAQAGRSERLAIADDVIVNIHSAEALRTEVAALHRRYQALAGAAAP
jgi:dephospho-CoA kinase